jgi:hypothetical protein
MSAVEEKRQTMAWVSTSWSDEGQELGPEDTVGRGVVGEHVLDDERDKCRAWSVFISRRKRHLSGAFHPDL